MPSRSAKGFAFRRWSVALGVTVSVALSSCDGTDGTLVVLHAGAQAGTAGMSGGGANAAENPYIPPEAGRWLARLDGAVSIDDDAEFFYLDAEQQEASDLAELHRQGRHYLCYLSAGSFEDFRDDADQFPETVIGNPLDAFPGERWLDVRDATVRQLMAARIARLAALGCDGVPPSSLAVHAAETGFSLTLDDSLDYARWVAERIHAAGMSAGLIGPAALTAELWPSFDFGLAIGCVAGTGCAEYEPLWSARRPVLYVELGSPEVAPGLCKAAKTLGFDALVTDRGFSGNCVVCRDIL